jgi:hypothetical protein
MTISNNASDPNQTFIGVINAPGYYVNVKSSFSFSGSIIGNSTIVSAAAKFHYDEGLGGGGSSATVSNYAFASWFEDNADSARGITY